jgi:hypothetical protein
MKGRAKMLTESERKILLDKGEDPDLPPAGVSEGAIGEGLRHWVCEVDGHEDPDRTGGCIHCGADL